MSPNDIAAEAVRRGAVQKPAELAPLLELLAAEPLTVAVEIGVYQGATLWAWSQLARFCVGIDSGVGVLGETVVPPGAQLVTGDSHDPATLEQLRGLLEGRPVDFLFIDGDHAYEGVLADWTTYAPLVRPGGLVAFHDILKHPDPGMGVERFWGEIREASALEFIAEPTWWGGIGVLRR